MAWILHGMGVGMDAWHGWVDDNGPVELLWNVASLTRYDINMMNPHETLRFCLVL